MFDTSIDYLKECCPNLHKTASRFGKFYAACTQVLVLLVGKPNAE